MYELIDENGRDEKIKDLKFNNPAEKVKSDDNIEVYAYEKYDKVIFHQLFNTCIPEVNQSENKYEFGELSDEKRTAINRIEFHLLNCSCDLSQKSQMDQCMNQKIAFTAQLLAIKSWCLIHQDKNIKQISGTKDSNGDYDGKDKDPKYEVKMSKETVLNISMGVNKLIAQCYDPLIEGYEIDDDGKEIDLASSRKFQTGIQECEDKYKGEKNNVMTGYDADGYPMFYEKYPGGHLKCIEDNETRMAEEIKKVVDTKNQKDFKVQGTECLSKSIDYNLNCTDSEDTNCLTLTESFYKSCIKFPYISGCVRKNNIKFKECEADADTQIDTMWKSLQFEKMIKDKKAEIEKCYTDVNSEFLQCGQDNNCRQLNHQQFMKCRYVSIKSWMKGFFKNELYDDDKPGFFTRVYRKVTGAKPKNEKISYRAKYMNMCMDRLQNCILSQRMIPHEGKYYALTKCDLELEKAKQIDDLWQTYLSAVSKMKYWGRIANIILYTNIALWILLPEAYGAIKVGEYVAFQVVAVSNIVVKRMVNYYYTKQIQQKLPFENAMYPQLPTLDQIDEWNNFAGSAEEAFDKAKVAAREAAKKTLDASAEAANSTYEAAKSAFESAKKAKNLKSKELFDKMKESAKKTWENQMTKGNFWLLSDIWLIFVQLHCPGCENATEFNEINNEYVNYLYGVHAHQASDFLYNKWSNNMYVSPLDIDEKTQRIYKSIVHDKVTDILFHMQQYHAVMKTKPEFADLYKYFDFEVDKVEAAQMKKMSKLGLELQNVSKVCMKQEMQADGSYKDLDSVAPSCVKRFTAQLEAKKKIQTGSYEPLLNYEDGRPSFKIYLDAIRISKNYAEKATDFVNLNINKRSFNSYSVDFNFGIPSFPSYISQVTFPSDSLLTNNENQDAIIDNMDIYNYIKFVNDDSQIRIQLNGLYRSNSMLTSKIGEIKSNYLGHNIIDFKKVCEHKDKGVIKFKNMVSVDKGNQAEDPSDDTLATAAQETKDVENKNYFKIINIPMTCEDTTLDGNCWTNMFKQNQASARIDIYIATDFERVCDWYSTDPPKQKNLYDDTKMFWVFDKSKNQERNTRLYYEVLTLNQITEYWKKETDYKYTKPGIQKSIHDKDNMKSIAYKYCSICCVNQPGYKDLIYYEGYYVECRYFTDYEGSTFTREEICDSDTALFFKKGNPLSLNDMDAVPSKQEDEKQSIWPFFFSNEKIPETDRIPMKCKDLYRLK